MIPEPSDTAFIDDHADDLLTRTEASAFLATFGIRLKPASLARLWSWRARERVKRGR